VGENIADNGGIRETFKAYEFYSQRSEGPQRLPYVSQYSPEQLLFLSFANVSQNKSFMSLNIFFSSFKDMVWSRKNRIPQEFDSIRSSQSRKI
jgi:predicted metalloendopeptidase